MDFFNYKHNDIEIKKDINIKLKTYEKVEDIIEKPIEIIPPEKEVENKINDLINKNEELSNGIKNEIANSVITGFNEVLDSTLLEHLDKFHNFIKGFLPGIKPYYKLYEDGSFDVYLQAYIDSRDYLLNEFGFKGENIVEEFDYNGNINLEQIYLSNDYSITNNGNIYHGNDLVFNCNNKKKIKVDYIDFSSGIIVFKPGVRIIINDILDRETLEKELIDDNPYYDDKDRIISFDNNNDKDDFTKDYIDKNKDEIEDEDKIKKDIDDEWLEEITLDDLDKIAPKEDIEDPLEIIKKKILDKRNFPSGIQTCNLNKINYLWLLFLLILGGGTEGEKPFPKTRGVCDYYDKPRRFGIGLGPAISGNAAPAKFRTGHNRLYNSRNQQGLKVGIVQLLYKFLEPFYNINLNGLEFSVAGTHIKLIPGLAIGATLEVGLLKFQEWISKEIRDMHGCDSQYIIPKLKETGEGLFLDGMEEIKASGSNSNDIEMYYRRNFAIIYNYTHYHTKYNDFSEEQKKDEMLRLYYTTKTSRKRSMSLYDIEKMIKEDIHITFSDILIDYHTGKPATSTEYIYEQKIEPSGLVKDTAYKTFSNVDVNVDPSNINKIIELGLYASYNCDTIDELDFFIADYSDSDFKPLMNY